MSTIRPGKDGEPLPPGTLVFRVGTNSQLNVVAIQQHKVSPIMFEPSSGDKESVGKRISIWVEHLTVADRAWAIMGSKPTYTVVACLDSEKVRAIPAPAGFQPLDAEWEQAVRPDEHGNLVPNTAPGAEGHAGIRGLIQGGNGKEDKLKRKELRSKLADVAEASPVPVPHNIPEEHLQVAAYYIHINHGGCGCSADDHWIMAVRQLRRQRVRAAR
jgi:hypothetical protein